MPKLNVTIKTHRKLSPKLKTWLFLAAESFSSQLPRTVKNAHLSLMFCGDTRMRRLNHEHRCKDKTTDVLSFPAQENMRHAPLELMAPGELILGDLVISLPQAKRQARTFGLSVEEEVVHLFAHGYLHLLGFDHEVSVKEEKLMEALEKKLLKAFSRKKSKK